MKMDDTIAAIATTLGESAISMIRVSGDKAIENISEIFEGKVDLRNVKTHTAHFGRIADENGNTLDDVVCIVYRKPRSFTGEDVIEICCHGGIHVTKRVFERIIETGIRPAQPGEFTKRAFINGKIDLTQAEAIADLIKAESDRAYITSVRQLEGKLSKDINKIREKMIDIIGLLELELDFVEEDIQLIDKRKVNDMIFETLREVESILKTYKFGKLWKEGLKVAIVGKPNAGKSSLLNTLLQEERAIVTEIPGTTRDFIEEKIIVDGIIFRLIDTAGIRETNDPIESEGVRRTWKIASESDIVLFVHDCTVPVSDEEIGFLKKLDELNTKAEIIFLNNKIDLENSHDETFKTGYESIGLSATKRIGIDELIGKMKQFAVTGDIGEGSSVIITSERHYSALLKAKDGLIKSLESVKHGESNEFIVVNLKYALDALGEIVGKVTTEEMLNNIFSKFCIGK